MSPVFDCRDEAQLLAGMRQARQAIGRGELVVLPTDTVYGVAADAFSARAVQRLLDAKGRGRQSPPPVLVAGHRDAARARRRGARARRAARRGVLAGRAHDRAAVAAVPVVGPRRDARHRRACGCRRTTSRSNCSRRPVRSPSRAPTSPARPPAIAADDAQDMLGDSVAVYLDGGPSATGVASTIIDATSLVGGADPLVRVLREGASTGRCARCSATSRAIPTPSRDGARPT